MIKYIVFLLIPYLLYSVDTREIKRDLEKPSIQRPSKSFPSHWGTPPEVQVRDIVKLPGGFGKGSSTLADWIKENIKNDKENSIERKKPETEKPSIEKKPIEKPQIPDEVKSAIETHKKVDAQLKASFQEKVKELGEKPSREEIKKVAETFKQEHSEIIEKQKELGKQIQTYFKENRPERPNRPELPEEIKEKIKQVNDKEKVLRQAKQELFEKLKESKELSKEEKQELIEKFKRDNAENHKQLKEAQKELQKKIRDTKQEADRRI